MSRSLVAVVVVVGLLLCRGGARAEPSTSSGPYPPLPFAQPPSSGPRDAWPRDLRAPGDDDQPLAPSPAVFGASFGVSFIGVQLETRLGWKLGSRVSIFGTGSIGAWLPVFYRTLGAGVRLGVGESMFLDGRVECAWGASIESDEPSSHALGVARIGIGTRSTGSTLVAEYGVHVMQFFHGPPALIGTMGVSLY